MPIIHFVFKGGSGIQRGANYWTWWLQGGTNATPNDAEDLADGLMERLSDNAPVPFHEYYNIGRVDWTYYPDLNEDPFPSQVYTFTPFVGVDTSNALPSRMTMLINFSAYANSGPVRKRVFLGVYGEALNNSSGNPDGTLISWLQGWANDMLGGLSVNGHDYSAAVARRDPVTGRLTAANFLSSQLVQAKWAYLRTRDSGAGI